MVNFKLIIVMIFTERKEINSKMSKSCHVLSFSISFFPFLIPSFVSAESRGFWVCTWLVGTFQLLWRGVKRLPEGNLAGLAIGTWLSHTPGPLLLWSNDLASPNTEINHSPQPVGNPLHVVQWQSPELRLFIAQKEITRKCAVKCHEADHTWNVRAEMSTPKCPGCCRESHGCFPSSPAMCWLGEGFRCQQHQPQADRHLNTFWLLLCILSPKVKVQNHKQLRIQARCWEKDAGFIREC